MDRQATTTECDPDCLYFDESMEAKALPLDVLKCITANFSEKNEIGRGGFSVVYKGLVVNLKKNFSLEVAVKKLLSQTSDIDDRKFHGEVNCLMKAKHKNIVRFLGYCSHTQGELEKYNGGNVMAEKRERLLCFEYLPNGSLDKYIRDTSLQWEKCYQIIKGVCKGLHYLHEKRIVHSDLKPANILLDSGMVPRITDFGLSRCFDKKQTTVVTSKPAGSWGYMAPEVFDRKISFKSDIYSLGIIIIEILTGNKGFPHVKDVLERWSESDKVEKLLEEEQLEEIRICTEVAQSCLDSDPEKRPTAQRIIDILKETDRSSTAGKKLSLIQTLRLNERRSRLPMDHGTVAEKLKAVKQAIITIFYGQYKRLSSFEMLHMYAKSLVVQNKGEELYSEVQIAMTSGVQSLFKPLEDAALVGGAAFLKELQARWNHHDKAVGMTRDIVVLRIGGKTFDITENKASLEEIGLRLWRENMARSDKIRPRLIEALKRQRGGEDELVAGVNEMLTKLGAEVMDVPCLVFRDGEGKLHVAGP